MSAGFRAGTSNDGYLQINGTDILTVSSGVLGVKNTGSQSEMRLYCESNNAHYASLKSPPHSDFIGNVTFTLPGTTGSSGQVLQTDGSGNLSWVNQSGGGGGGGVSDKMSEGNTEAEVVDTGSDGHFKVTTEGVERLRIISDGAVNIGVNPAQATGTNTQNAILTVKGYPGTETSAAILALVRGNTTTSTSANHTMGRIVFADKQAGEYAFIEGESEATGAVGDTPGRLVFSTANDNSSAPSEKLRITAAGEIVSTNGTLRRDLNTASFTVSGGTASNIGANINLYGGSHSSLANVFRVRIGTSEKLRVGPSGQIGLGGANYGTSGQVLTSGGASGAVSWTTISGGGGSYGNSDVDNHLNSGAASSGQILSWNGSDYAWVADQGGSGGGGISDVADDTTPQLGGNLDLNSKDITGTGDVTITGVITATTFSGSGASLTTLNASELDSGTIPDARFPATLPAASGTNLTSLPAANLTGTLPAISGTNLTNLDASDLASGTIPDARFSATLPAISGANLTTLNASELDSGTVPDARFPATLPAVSGANLTNLPSDTPADTDVQVTYDLSANGTSAYRFTGPGYSGADDNPDLYLVRGQRYRFINATGGHPFRIQSNTSGTAYTDGVSGSQTGTQDFNVQYNAPERLYYQCTSHSAMIGNIYIVGASDWRMTDVATSATPEIYTDRKVYFGMDTSYDNNSYGQFKEGISIIRGDENGVVANATAAGEPIGGIYFNDARSGTYGSIHCVADGTPGTNDYPGRLAFRTASDGNSYTTERLRIDSLGSTQFKGQNAPAGLDTRISQYGSLLVATSGELISNARCSIDSGNGTITTTGNGLFAVNTSTYQTGINLNTSSNLSTLTVYSNNSSTHRSLVVYDNGQSGANKYRAAIYANGNILTRRLFLGGSTNGGFDYNSTADTLEFLTTNGGTHSELNASAYVPSTNAGKDLGHHNKRWDSIYCTGVAFDGNTDAAATLLDDYEEGTYTPKMYAGTGTTEPAYNWRYGQYVKIGEKVTVWGALGINGSFPSASSIYVGNLPYSQVWDTNNFFYYVQLHGYTWASGYSDSGSDTKLFLQPANTVSNRFLVVNGANKINTTNSMIGSGQRFTFCVSYVAG